MTGPHKTRRSGRRASRGLGRLFLSLLIVVVGAAAALFVWVGRESSSGVAASPLRRAPGKGVPDSALTDEERMAYLKEHVVLENLTLGPDTKPKEDEPVPGLLRVSGTLKNRGDRTLERAHLSVHPQDQAGKVISSYVEEVLDGRPLAPGKSRDFVFRIPARSEYSGKFGHHLR